MTPPFHFRVFSDESPPGQAGLVRTCGDYDLLAVRDRTAIQNAQACARAMKPSIAPDTFISAFYFAVCSRVCLVLLRVDRSESRGALIHVSSLVESGRPAKMGKRKSKRKPPPKSRAIEPLETQFNCPFCNHERVCEVKMDRDRNVGFISCRICMEDFQTNINSLSEPIDVYSDWIDACEEANQ
uniref:Transcription elongation factor 1 homolog n=1 Tax=Steinernema glaseri TaxID=37863 RepID=A0A1I7ZM50_9BILA